MPIKLRWFISFNLVSSTSRRFNEHRSCSHIQRVECGLAEPSWSSDIYWCGFTWNLPHVVPFPIHYNKNLFETNGTPYVTNMLRACHKVKNRAPCDKVMTTLYIHCKQDVTTMCLTVKITRELQPCQHQVCSVYVMLNLADVVASKINCLLALACS